jgi:hypothetical protein
MDGPVKAGRARAAVRAGGSIPPPAPVPGRRPGQAGTPASRPAPAREPKRCLARDEGAGAVMAWVKVDDQFFRHPKVMSAGRDARDLYLVGLCYCAQSLTDGFIPRAALRVLGAEAEIDQAQASADRLVEVGLWELAAEGYMVHDYHKYQPTRERVLATREVRAEAGSRGGKQKASNLLDKTLANAKQNSAPYPSRTPTPELT